MRIYKTKNYDEMSRKAANIISAQMILKQNQYLVSPQVPRQLELINSSSIGIKKGIWISRRSTASIWMNTKDLTHPIRKATLISCVTIFLIM